MRRWRGISAEKIVEHMEYMDLHYNINGFQFYDDEFDVDEKRVLKMCELLISRGKKYRFGHFSRVNQVNLKRLEAEKKAGLSFIEFGIESGSNEILKFIDKDQTVEVIRRAFKMCRQTRVKAGALFMLGLPGETEEQVLQTKRLVDSLKAHQTIATIFKPYPATKLYDFCVSKNLFKLPDTLEDQGEIYALGDLSVNVSRVPINKLKKIYNYFALQSIINELINCIVCGNWRLIFYYARFKFVDRLKYAWKYFFYQ